jgi:hypothetical protein
MNAAIRLTGSGTNGYKLWLVPTANGLADPETAKLPLSERL